MLPVGVKKPIGAKNLPHVRAECPFPGRQVLRLPPWISVLLQTMHDIIGNSVAFCYRQFLTKSA